jgi:hypothetical protein
MLPSVAVKEPPVTVTAVPALRLSADDVTFGVSVLFAMHSKGSGRTLPHPAVPVAAGHSQGSSGNGH